MQPFFHRLKAEVDKRRQDGLLRELKLPPNAKINLSSNDYLQLRNHPAVLENSRKYQEEFGASSSASPLLFGYLPCHEQLLQTLLQWKNKSSGLIFNCGFMANQAVLKHLPGPNDLILADKLVHHSMIQALSQSKAKHKRYRHLDLNHLEECLDKNKRDYETIFVITESVFSMDGDYPDLKALAALKTKYSFIWILDEAHGTGCFGPTGCGLAEAMGVLGEVDILIGTLGKALASFGGYVLTQSKLITEYLINFSGEFIYSTYLPPAQTGAALSAISLVKESINERLHLQGLGKLFRQRLVESGWETNEFDSQIVPIIIGDNHKTLDLKNRLQEHGFLVGAVRPPTVPANTARLRVSLHSGVTDENLQEFITVLKNWRS